MHARRSSPAEPAVARFGNGISVPMRGFKILSSTERGRGSVKSGSFFFSSACERRSARARSRTHVAARRSIALADQLDEPPSEHGLRAFAERELTAGPVDRERVRLAIEPAIAANLVRRDHVDPLLVELLARVARNVLRLRREADRERRALQLRDA